MLHLTILPLKHSSRDILLIICMHFITEFNPKGQHYVDIIVCIMLILDVNGCLQKKIAHTMPSPQWIKNVFPDYLTFLINIVNFNVVKKIRCLQVFYIYFKKQYDSILVVFHTLQLTDFFLFNT